MDEDAAPKHQKLPPPRCIVPIIWDIDYIRKACEKSSAALDTCLETLSISGDHHHQASLHLMNATHVENIYLVNSLATVHYAPNNMRQRDQWGARDIMLNLGKAACTPEQRMEYLRAAANFSGRAVHLLGLKDLSKAEESAWLEALREAAMRDTAPKSLLISSYKFSTYELLDVLEKCKGLNHLSLQWGTVDHASVCMLSSLSSLISLTLVDVEAPRVEELAALEPSDSPLAASLLTLDIFIVRKSFLDVAETMWRRGSVLGILCYWPQLKELTLMDSRSHLTETDVKNIMPILRKKMTLYSLTLGRISPDVTVLDSLTGYMLEALSLSGLGLLTLYDTHMNVIPLDPVVEAQLFMNRAAYQSSKNHETSQGKAILPALERVPAASMRLFICGDPFAGKTTLLSTMISMSVYTQKVDKLRSFLICGHCMPSRTQGIEVRAIEHSGIRVSLWDMAGQQEFHAFHDCMLPDTGISSYQAPSMFKFVWSSVQSTNSKNGTKKTSQEFNKRFRYWLKFLASKSRRSNITLKLIVVFTRADQLDLLSAAHSYEIDSLRTEFKEVVDIIATTFEVDARKKDGRMKDLIKCIFNNASQTLQGIQVYKICTQVSYNLSKHLKATNERIITWSQFCQICKGVQLSIPIDEPQMKAIALSLNDSGIIIYVNSNAHIILDPNWFCNQMIGCLIHFPKSKPSRTIEIDGFTNQSFLEAKLESITKSEVKGSLLVDVMEAMHLCCKVSNDGDQLFIPATLQDPVETHHRGAILQWRASGTSSLDYQAYAYMGRRLECENQDLTFLTPGLFPRIQVLFNNAFKSEEINVDLKLGKDFISICLPNKEIIVVFCQAKSNHVIDVLVRTLSNTQQDGMASNILAYVEKHIIDNLITICAQPTGIQGVKLIESVLRPDSLQDPWKTENREDQCVQMTYLKEQLRKQLEQGELQYSHVWKETNHMRVSITNSLIDLLGPDNYSEVLMSYREWLKEARYTLLEDHEVNGSEQHENHPNVSMITSLDSKLVQDDGTLEERMEERSSKEMAMAILSLHQLHDKVDSLHVKMDEMKKELNEMHEELKHMREDVMNKVEKALGKLSWPRRMRRRSYSLASSSLPPRRTR